MNAAFSERGTPAQIGLWDIEAVELKESGDVTGAWHHLMKLLGRDIRCIDAHVHLGNLIFDIEETLPTTCAHYEIAVRLGEHQLGEGFDGVLPWALIDYRPFLRGMHGFALTAWRLGAFAAAQKLLERLLWLCPWDNLGGPHDLARDTGPGTLA